MPFLLCTQDVVAYANADTTYDEATALHVLASEADWCWQVSKSARQTGVGK
jgi:hypothetical protein